MMSLGKKSCLKLNLLTSQHLCCDQYSGGPAENIVQNEVDKSNKHVCWYYSSSNATALFITHYTILY